MNGLYTEHCIKRNPSVLQKAGKIALIAFVALMLLAGIMLMNGIFAFLGVAGIAALFFVLPYFKQDYEYIFVDGQIDFDRISGGEKRKNMLRLDLDNIDVMAPEKSYHLDNYRNQNGITVKDFTSNTEGRKIYCIFLAKDGNKMMVKFEPSDKMVEFSKQKAPRKVFAD